MKRIMVSAASIALCSSIISDTAVAENIGGVEWEYPTYGAMRVNLAGESDDRFYQTMAQISYGIRDYNRNCNRIVSLDYPDSNIVCMKVKCDTLFGNTMYALYNMPIGKIKYGADSCDW